MAWSKGSYTENVTKLVKAVMDNIEEGIQEVKTKTTEAKAKAEEALANLQTKSQVEAIAGLGINTTRVLGEVEGTVKLKLTEGSLFTATVKGPTTFVVEGAPASNAENVNLAVKQNGVGGNAWSVTGAEWYGPELPSFQLGGGLIYLVQLFVLEGGSVIYAAAAGGARGTTTTEMLVGANHISFLAGAEAKAVVAEGISYDRLTVGIETGMTGAEPAGENYGPVAIANGETVAKCMANIGDREASAKCLNEKVKADWVATAAKDVELCIAQGFVYCEVMNEPWLYGKSKTAAAWSSATAYTAGMAVTSESKTWRCIATNTNKKPPNATFWVETSGFATNYKGEADEYAKWFVALGKALEAKGLLSKVKLIYMCVIGYRNAKWELSYPSNSTGGKGWLDDGYAALNSTEKAWLASNCFGLSIHIYGKPGEGLGSSEGVQSPLAIQKLHERAVALNLQAANRLYVTEIGVNIGPGGETSEVSTAALQASTMKALIEECRGLHYVLGMWIFSIKDEIQKWGLIATSEGTTKERRPVFAIVAGFVGTKV